MSAIWARIAASSGVSAACADRGKAKAAAIAAGIRVRFNIVFFQSNRGRQAASGKTRKAIGKTDL